jgi:O-antigen/teichoic acid export membrane protein
LGLETKMLRQMLLWIKFGDNKLLKEYTTQALFSRFIGFLILLPFLIIYIIYLYFYKYEMNYLFLLITFIITSLITSINDSISLILRSKGEFLLSQGAKLLNSYFAKFFSIILFFTLGDFAYVIFVSVSSLPLFVFFFLKILKYVDFKYISFSETFKKINDSKIFWIKTKLDYFKSNFDSFLVSIFLPPFILGSYTIFKTLENISKTLIEGFFDVLTQNSVKEKGNQMSLIALEKRIKRTINYFIFFIVFCLIVFLLFNSLILNIINLRNYDYIYEIFIIFNNNTFPVFINKFIITNTRTYFHIPNSISHTRQFDIIWSNLSLELIESLI